MVGKIIRSLALIPFLCLMGCSSQMESDPVDLLSAFDFENGDQEWDGGISDYPVEYKDSLSFIVENNLAPISSFIDGNGLNISADNPHGDIFYFFKRKVDGLIPNRNYILDFEFLVYTKLETISSSSTAEDIYLKIGAVGYEPALEQQTWRNSMEYIALNIDKGDSNAESGADMISLGSIKKYTSDLPEVISGNTFGNQIASKSDNNGSIWLVIGVDSGIKNKLTFGLEALTVFYKEQN